MLREHQHGQKLLSHLVNFSVGVRGGVRLNLLTKENLWKNIFFRCIKDWVKSLKLVKTGSTLDSCCLHTQCTFWIYFSKFLLLKINSHVILPKFSKYAFFGHNACTYCLSKIRPEKIISTDETDVKQQDIKERVAMSYKFL